MFFQVKKSYRMEIALLFVHVPPSSVVTFTFHDPVVFPAGMATVPVIDDGYTDVRVVGISVWPGLVKFTVVIPPGSK